MVRDLNSILGYIDRLNELDTAKVPPMAQVSDRYGVDGRSRAASASPTPAAKICMKDCASRCRTTWRWPMRRNRTERFQSSESD